MSITAEAVQHELRDLVRRLAEPVRAGESIQALIHRVARKAGMPSGWVKRIWYQEWAVVPAHVADTLRSLDLERECAQAKKGVLTDEIDRLLAASVASRLAVAGDCVEPDQSRGRACHLVDDPPGAPSPPGLGPRGG